MEVQWVYDEFLQARYTTLLNSQSNTEEKEQVKSSQKNIPITQGFSLPAMANQISHLVSPVMRNHRKIRQDRDRKFSVSQVDDECRRRKMAVSPMNDHFSLRKYSAMHSKECVTTQKYIQEDDRDFAGVLEMKTNSSWIKYYMSLRDQKLEYRDLQEGF